ncbi:MAG TPA: discoidin domain-containing protein [Thermoanaerobaculia bacterium]
MGQMGQPGRRVASSVLSVLSVLFVLSFPSCKPAPETPPPATKPPAIHTDPERDNLLSLFAGATVLSRSSELTLENSAIHTIDGDADSYFIALAPNDVTTITYALGGRARITSLEPHTPREKLAPKKVTFESSLDGVTYTPATAPFEASHVRVSIESGEQRAVVGALLARGTLLDTRPIPPLEGCWTINGLPARILQSGASVTGMIGNDIHIGGSSNGGVYRVAWTEGPQLGVAAIGVSPDGQRLSAARWFQDPMTLFEGPAWFGERTACGTTPSDIPNPRSRYVYDAAMLTAAPRKITVHEFRETSAAANRARAQRRVDELRAALQQRGIDVSRTQFVAAGADQPWREVVSQAAREMMSVAVVER